MLIATIFTIGQCNRWNELVAMKASGISLYRIIAPLLLVSLAMSVLTLMIEETVLPYSNNQKRTIYDHRILKKPETKPQATALIYQGRRGVLYSIQRYDPQTRRMDHVTLVKKDRSGRLVYRIDANDGDWRGDRWILRNGYLRYFTSGQEETTYRFARLTSSDLEERPEDFARPPKKPEDMNYFELRRFIDRQRREGVATREDEVYLNMKIAYPFASLIIVLFGAPLATISKRGGATANFGVSLFIFILFWGFIQSSRALGKSGTVDPLLAAWMANIAFGTAGIGILLNVRK